VFEAVPPSLLSRPSLEKYHKVICGKAEPHRTESG